MTGSVEGVVVSGLARVVGAIVDGSGGVESAEAAAELTGDVDVGEPTGADDEGSSACEHPAVRPSTTGTASHRASLGRLIRC